MNRGASAAVGTSCGGAFDSPTAPRRLAVIGPTHVHLTSSGGGSLLFTAQNIHKSFDHHPVLDGAALAVANGIRIGLVGANGVGKSTLLQIIAGRLPADRGAVVWGSGARLGFLPQEPPDRGAATLADILAVAHTHLLALEKRMRELEGRMTTAHGDELAAVLAEYGEVSDRFERDGGYERASREAQVLAGLHLDYLPRHQPASTLSGGERARLGMAELLLTAPDVLLLDEPTNHLDQASLRWLEDWLSACPGGVVMASHDREFLNRVATDIVEIDEHTRRTRHYHGDYDAWAEAKARERAQWLADYERQQEEIKALRLEMHETARRNTFKAITDGDKFIKYKKEQTHQATVSKKVRSAAEKLSRIEEDPVARPPKPLRFTADFDPEAMSGRLPLIASGLSKTYDGRVILDDVSLALGARGRIMLVGPNGCGKSTLLRLLAGAEAPDSGEVRRHPAARIGYLDQDGAALNNHQTLFEAYRRGLPELDQVLKSTLIESGLFRFDQMDVKVGSLSSGQRRKLQIARLIAERANLLILDEPTNFVSFDVLESLEAALRLFPGPVIAASHDRRFVRQFGGDLWRVESGALRQWIGTSEDYFAALGTAHTTEA
jgi:macrolide transport system ATP-binding/permease protein